MSSRSYLSIGDVLTLLREEFPDVTISKIRFLESQGLVNPERSPSGYRKFYEGDVERLRWVLRQQREHFLPLKVIRDRLAAGDLSDTGAEAGAPVDSDGVGSEDAHRIGVVAEPAHAGAGAGVGARGGVRTAAAARSGGSGSGASSGASSSRSSGVGSTSGRTEAQLAQADNEAMARILADASRRSALIPSDNGNDRAGNDRAALHVVPDPSPAGDARRASSAAPSTAAGVAAGSGAAPSGPSATDSQARAGAGSGAGVGPGMSGNRGSGSGLSTSIASKGATSDPAGAAGPRSTRPETKGTSSVTAAGHIPSSGPSGAAGAPEGVKATGAALAGPSASASASGSPGSSSGKGSTTTNMVTGASLTAEELCAASGLSADELTGLQGFGLIEPVMVGGMPTFDEDALTVANLAHDFRKFGIEARHLRLYRNAVDREVGLIEQVIIPLLRQRNPESRQRAIDAADELGALGQTLRATLLRAALSRHVGG